MESELTAFVHQDMILVLSILVAGMIGGPLSRLLRVPDVAVFLLIGVLAGPILHVVHLLATSVFNQLIITVGATLILFDGGRAIGLGILKKVWMTITMLAIPGVLITAGLTAATAVWLLDIPMIYAFLLAAIIASTDPATLIPVFKQVSIDERLKQTVESESAFNDATGSIVVFATLGIITGAEAFSISGTLVHFFVMALGGIAVGLLLGWIGAMLISVKRSGFLREYAAVVIVVVALGADVIGDLLSVSGFMATFTAGLVLGNHKAFGWPVSEATLGEVGHFFDGLTLIMRMMIFILLGSQVDFSALLDFWWQGLIIVAVFMLIARPVTVFLCAGLDRYAKWKWNELLFMCWVRETGVIPAALVALIAGLNLPHYREIQAVTFMAILLTIILQAGTTGIVANKLGVAKHSGETNGQH